MRALNRVVAELLVPSQLCLAAVLRTVVIFVIEAYLERINARRRRPSIDQNDLPSACCKPPSRINHDRSLEWDEPSNLGATIEQFLTTFAPTLIINTIPGLVRDTHAQIPGEITISRAKIGGVCEGATSLDQTHG